MEKKGYYKKKPSKYQQFLNQVDPKIRQKWKEIQDSLKTQLIETDQHPWTIGSNSQKELKLIGGMDISTSKSNPNYAVSALVICDINLNIVYEDYKFIQLTEPYVPGFLAFREVKHCINLLEDLKKQKPEFIPDVILIDGNGILHVNRFGLASHFGVIENICTIGCSKTVFAVDGINKYYVKEISRKFKKRGDFEYLIGYSGAIWGAALKSTDESNIPMIISIGHKVSLKTCLDVVLKTTKYRVPEPIRLSDKISRRIVSEYTKRKFVQFDIKQWLNQNHIEIYSELQD